MTVMTESRLRIRPRAAPRGAALTRSDHANRQGEATGGAMRQARAPAEESGLTG